MNRLGSWGEAEAARFLEEKGYRIVERNYRCPAGEIDLIARSGETTVLVEVKTRRSARCGTPGEAVAAGKRRQLRYLAGWYLALHPDCPDLRIDVVEVWEQAGKPRFQHIRSAVETG